MWRNERTTAVIALGAFVISLALPTFDPGPSTLISQKIIYGWEAFYMTVLMIPQPVTQHPATSVAAFALTVSNIIMIWLAVLVSFNRRMPPRKRTVPMAAGAAATGLLPVLNVYPVIGSTQHLLAGYYIWEATFLLICVSVVLRSRQPASADEGRGKTTVTLPPPSGRLS